MQSGRGVSKQADGFEEAIGDILPETFSIKTICNCSGMDHEVVVKAAQFKDLLAIFVILARLPKDVNASYQGKIRELLTPYLEDMSSFSMKTFVKLLEDYEDRKNLFGDKEKTKAQANVVKGRESRPFGSRGYDKATKPKPDPATIKKLQDAVTDKGRT